MACGEARPPACPASPPAAARRTALSAPAAGGSLPPGRGDGEPRFPRPPAHGLRPHLPAGGAWGNAVSPSPCLRVRPSCGRGRGETGFPILLRTGCALTFPRAGVWGHPVSPSPCARAAPLPSRGRGRGDTRFPHPPAQGRRPHPPAGGGVRTPGFPTPLAEGVCSRQGVWSDDPGIDALCIG
jgi:hypothetical protein